MEEKNLALLGFISKAADYLKDNLSDESLEIKELKEVDLDKIKNELSNKIDNSFHGANSSENLINAGKEAFDSFISKNSMIDEFKDLFDGKEESVKKDEDDEVIDHLMNILKNPDEEKPEDDEYVNIISNAVNSEETNKPVSVEIYKDAKQDEEIDNIFSEILANENLIDDFISNNDLKDEDQETCEETNVNMSSNEFKQILEDVLGDVYNKINKSNDEIIEKFKDIEKELESQKAIIESKKETDEILDTKYEPVSTPEDVKNNNTKDDVVSNYFKNLNESFSLKEDKDDEAVQDDTELDPFVTVDDILTLEDNKQEDEEVDLTDDKKVGVSLLDPEYIEAFHNRPIEDMFVLNPCLDALEEQEKAEALRKETEAKEKEAREKAKIEKELEDIFGEFLNVPEEKEEPKPEEPIKENNEEETFKSFVDQEYIDDYNNRPIEDIYITNPSLDYVEQQEKENAKKQEEDNQEAELIEEDTINVDEIKNKALRDLEKQILESEKLEEELQASLEEVDDNKQDDETISCKEYLDDYNKRSIEDIYIANPGADQQEAQLEEELEEENKETIEEESSDEASKAIDEILDLIDEDFSSLGEDNNAFINQEYLDDYNARPIEDIYIANPGASEEETSEDLDIENLELEEINNEITDDLLDIDSEQFDDSKDETLNINQEYIDEYNNRPIEDIYIANPGALQEDEETTIEEPILEEEVNDEVCEEELSEDNNDEVITCEEKQVKEEKLDSVSDLLNEYDDNISEEIESKKLRQEELRREIYNSIKSIYPYLSNGFIKGVYDLKDSLANDYKEDEEIIILHRLRFKDVVGLRKFVDIILSHDYLVNVDEKQMIVDTFKEHINSDGKILTDIFEVANQAKLLTGEYEGYRIIEKDA